MDSPRNRQEKVGSTPNCLLVTLAASGGEERKKRVQVGLEKWSKGLNTQDTRLVWYLDSFQTRNRFQKL
jgi:hypothetical protein